MAGLGDGPTSGFRCLPRRRQRLGAAFGPDSGYAPGLAAVSESGPVSGHAAAGGTGEAGIGFAQGWHKLLAGLAAWVRRQPSPVDRTEQDEGLIVGLLALRVLAQGEDWTCFQAAHSALLAGEAQSDVLDAWEEGSSRPEQLAAVLAGIPPVSDPEADVYTEAQKATLERLKQSVPEKDPDLRAFLTRVGQMKRADLHRLPPALADHLAASLPELEDQALQEALRTLCAGSPTARLLLELAATGVFESSPVVSGELRSVGTE